MPIVTEDELLNRLRRITEATSQKEVADRFGVSPQYLNDIIQCKRSIANKVLNGMKAVPLLTVYIIDDRKWTKRDTKSLKRAWDNVWYEDIE